MSQATVAIPWAQALLDISVAKNELRGARGWLDELASLMNNAPDLRSAFGNPTVSVAERKGILTELSTRLNWSVSFRNFVFLLNDRRRLPYVPAIAREFRRLADQHDGILRATARTAVSLDSVQVALLRNALQNLTGRKVEVEQSVEPGLIGGLQVYIDGRVYDTTVRAQLDGLRQSILKELR